MHIVLENVARRARPLDGAAYEMSMPSVRANASARAMDRNAIYLPKFHYVFVLSTLNAALIGGVVFARAWWHCLSPNVFTVQLATIERTFDNTKRERAKHPQPSHMVRGGAGRNELIPFLRLTQSSGSSWIEKTDNVSRTNPFSLFTFGFPVDEELTFATNWAIFFLSR